MPKKKTPFDPIPDSDIAAWQRVKLWPRCALQWEADTRRDFPFWADRMVTWARKEAMKWPSRHRKLFRMAEEGLFKSERIPLDKAVALAYNWAAHHEANRSVPTSDIEDKMAELGAYYDRPILVSSGIKPSKEELEKRACTALARAQGVDLAPHINREFIR